MKEIGLGHPGRSVEFLSRLHDGELQPAERVRFEAHRAHCAECRRAAIEFEDALSLFRSARSTPPRSDLAARILRKVQTTNRPRAPFPMRFRIDLGWAAVLLTALFAILIMTPEFARQRGAAPGPASLPAPAPQPAPQVVQEPPVARRVVRESRENAPLADSRAAAPRDEREPAPAAEGKVAAPWEKGETAAARDRSDAPEARREMPRAAAASPEPASAGSEGEAALRPAPAAPPLRLSISEIDGFGVPPALVSDVRIALPATERGREYVLMVDSQGIVRQVSRASSDDSDRTASARRRQISKAEAAAPAPLSGLRFEPGNRPRRLLVRID
jgi:putative zinc finger protein